MTPGSSGGHSRCRGWVGSGTRPGGSFPSPQPRCRGEAGAGRAAGPKPPDGNTSLLTRCGFRAIAVRASLFCQEPGRAPAALPSPGPSAAPARHGATGTGGSTEPLPARSGCSGRGAARPLGSACHKPPFIPTQNRIVWGSPSGTRRVMEPPARPSSAPRAAAAATAPTHRVNGAAGVSLCPLPAGLSPVQVWERLPGQEGTNPRGRSGRAGSDGDAGGFLPSVPQG